jgi:hypothetical protein
MLAASFLLVSCLAYSSALKMKEICFSGFILTTLPYSSEGCKSSPREDDREQLQNMKDCHGVVEGTLPELT